MYRRPASRTIISTSLQPLANARFMERMSARHNTDIIFSLILIKTNQTLRKKNKKKDQQRARR
jgi:hypothetical protein